LRLLAPFGCETTVVRRSEQPVPGSSRVLTHDHLHDALRGADAVVLALPLLDETRGMLGAEELALLAPGGWVVNVARGVHVDTGALLEALDGPRGGAALDVTDPEPLPDGHRLWAHPKVIITPHTGNTREMAKPLRGNRISGNVRRYAAGEQLEGLIDPDLGY